MPSPAQTMWRKHMKDMGSIAQIKSEDYAYDYVLVYDLGDKEKKVKTKKSGEMTQAERYSRIITSQLRALQTAGLKLSLYRSVQGDELYVLIGATEERLRYEAHRSEYDLCLDPRRAIDIGTKMKVRLAIKTVDNEKDPRAKYCAPEIWENLYGKYDKDANPLIYRTYLSADNKTESLFRPVDRFKLIVSIVEADTEQSGAEIAIGEHLGDGDHPALSFFPLHDDAALRALEDDWKPYHMFSQPVHLVREYFGEKIALYFGFLGFYNRALLFPAVLGIIYFILQMVNESQRVDVSGIWVLGFSMAIWGTVFLEMWKRREAKLRMFWGMTHFAAKEQTRPEFRGQFINSSVDGRLELYFPFTGRLVRLLFSGSVIFTLIACVIASVSGIFWWRSTIPPEDSETLIGISVINAIQIQVLNYVYSTVSGFLNEKENHRTDTKFENALIAKSFIFKFINSYNSLFYISFIKWGLENRCAYAAEDGSDGVVGCLSELRVQLAIIFGTSIVVNNAIEIGKPFVMAKIKARQQAGGAEDAEKTEAEKQFELADVESTFDDYDELVLQYGFVVLFIVALPVTPLFALVNNYLEAWLDSRKYTRLTKRPEPRGAVNIGTWYDILNVMTIIAIITNVALCVLISGSFADSPLRDNDDGGDVWIFLIAEHAIFLMKFAAEYFVPDVPGDVRKHMAREQYIVAALVDEVPDELDEPAAVAAEDIADAEENFDYIEAVPIGFEGKPVEYGKIAEANVHKV